MRRLPQRLLALPAALGLALLLLAAAPARAQLLPAFGSDRAGTSGFQFLKIPVDARAAAMGETVAANAFDASALFWNPALAAQAGALQVGLSHTAYFADVSMAYAALIVPLRRHGLSFGASLQALNSGEMSVNTEFEPTGTGETFRFVDLAAGLSVAQTLTDLFSYGVTAKLVHESVAGISTSTVVFDLGFFYRVGTTGAQMAVAIRNFGLDAAPQGELSRVVITPQRQVVETDFESLTPPTTFMFGLTYNLLREDPQHHLILSGQLTNPNDNAESFNVGVEYTWRNTLSLRTGYRFGIAEYTLPSAGLGLQLPFLGPDLRFDYGFTQLERLGDVHRIGLNVRL